MIFDQSGHFFVRSWVSTVLLYSQWLSDWVRNWTTCRFMNAWFVSRENFDEKNWPFHASKWYLTINLVYIKSHCTRINTVKPNGKKYSHNSQMKYYAVVRMRINFGARMYQLRIIKLREQKQKNQYRMATTTKTNKGTKCITKYMRLCAVRCTSAHCK